MAQPLSQRPKPRPAGVLLIIGGGIAAYKSLDLIRRLRERGMAVRVVMTAAAQKFITPLSAGAISGEQVFTDLFDPASEFDVGHIRLSREADLIVVAPATADLMAKLAGGHADDLATAVLLATDKKILLAPAMNPRMWSSPATARNIGQLAADGVVLVGPNEGEMAERGEHGIGRMAEPLEIVAAIEGLLAKPKAARPLAGKRVIVTSGPTHEPIDPVRYIGNRSSGKQGHAIAAAAAAAGADGRAGERTGGADRSRRRARRQSGNGAADAGRGGTGAAGRHRDLRCGRRRLAGGANAEPEDQEIRQGAAAGADGKP